MTHLGGTTIRRISASKYKYVSKSIKMCHGKSTNGFNALIPNYRYGKAIHKFFCSEKEAAVYIDTMLLKIGKSPVNILKRK